MLAHIAHCPIFHLPHLVPSPVSIQINIKPSLWCWHPCCFHIHSSKSVPRTPKIPMRNRDGSNDPNSNTACSTSMMAELSRAGRIGEARQLFDRMPDRDVVAWTTMITAYVKCRMMEEARRLFDRSDAKKNVVTWTAMVSGYIKANRITEAEKIFNIMPDKNVVSWNTMIDGYARNGQTDLALHLFKKMPERNVVSWNTIITLLAQCARVEEARQLFNCMPARDVITWTAMVAGLSKNGKIDEARQFFERMPERNVVSWNALLTGYAQNSRVDDALQLFERMPQRDIPSWNTMITGLIQNGDLERAIKLFNEMPWKNVISWTTMITGYVHDGQNEEALKIFSRLLADNKVKPNQGTFVTVLGACSNLASLSKGQQIHQIISKMVYQDNTYVVSALINMYSKCGELGMARKMFDDSLPSQRDLISWNGMITAYSHHGCGRDAILLFRKMQDLGFRPDDSTYVGLLSACGRAGLVEKGLEFFGQLVRDRSINMREDHYACLVDLCGRAGRLKEAFDLIEKLGTELSATALSALLAGCNVHGNVTLGKLVAKKLLKVEPDNVGAYLSLSNMYAFTGNWRGAAKVRLTMKYKGLKKQPGCSWVEVGNRVNVFVAGEKSHNQSNLLYPLLRDLHLKMGRARFIPGSDVIVDEEYLHTDAFG